MAPSEKAKTYRVRQLPGQLSRPSHAGRLLAEILGDVEPDDVRVFSLATSLNPLEIPATKVATVVFSLVPRALNDDETEWIIPGKLHGLPRDVIVDTHFQDFTPLNDVPQDEHELDCIAISGLASHPFGSWKNRGRRSNFMWLRDRLPRELSNVRSIIYGYDTALIDSESIKGIDDIAVAFIQKMKSIGKSGPSAKPLLMLAHSLGGIVLKQAMIMMARTEDQNNMMLESIRGVVFFGVPNKGMMISHLLPMVQDRPNAEIVHILSTKSDYLRDLDAQFSGIVQHRDMEILSVYETMRSPTTKQDAMGRWSRNGLPDLLVDKSSAIQDQSSLIMPIDEDHSNLVKFGADDQDCQAIIKFMHNAAEKTVSSNTQARRIGWNADISDEETDEEDDIIAMRSSLNIGETGHRLDEIASQYKSTFEWIFDDEKLGFASWLGDERGLFWISGKPGSGKSTLMKLALRDYRTSKLFSTLKTGSVIVDYFFHDRGSSMQKSLEGFLSRILHQIMISEKKLAYLALPQFLSRPERTRLIWSLQDLRQVLEVILGQRTMDFRILIFVDALDEFDGEPETVAEFINDLLRARPGSRTKVKVCCSSRPWNVFKDTFGDAAGCKVHEKTTGDIKRYIDGRFDTNTSMKAIMQREEAIGDSKIQDLKAELSRRAEGVFIWVRLVLDELLKACTDGAMPQELMHTLSSFPDDLDKSYQRLIDRIPLKYRFESYVLIEIVLRSLDPFGLRDLGLVLQCALGKSPADCVQRLPFDPYSEDFLSSMKRRLQSRCGGMLEVLPNTTVQFMHQTAKEYFGRPGSTEAILQHDQKLCKENGYSFLTKFWLSLASASTVHFDWKTYILSIYSNKFGYILKPHYQCANPVLYSDHGINPFPIAGFNTRMSILRCLQYAYRSERTTGHSQGEFLDGCDDKAFMQFLNEKPASHRDAAVSFAEAAGLRIYLAEILESREPQRVKRNGTSMKGRSHRQMHPDSADEGFDEDESRYSRRYVRRRQDPGSYASQESYPSSSSSSRRRANFYHTVETQPHSYRAESNSRQSSERMRPRRRREEARWDEYTPQVQIHNDEIPVWEPESSHIRPYHRSDPSYLDPWHPSEYQARYYTTEQPSYPIPQRQVRNRGQPRQYEQNGQPYSPFQHDRRPHSSQGYYVQQSDPFINGAGLWGDEAYDTYDNSHYSRSYH